MFELKQYFKILIICFLVILKVSLVFPRIQSRILTGTLTSIQNAPFLVRLLGDNEFICGGALIGSRYVLTAAHCIEGQRYKNLTVVAGVTHSHQTGERSNVEGVMFPFDVVLMDIAVLKLRYPVYGTKIRPVELCTTAWNPGADVHIFGWGKVNKNDKHFSSQLRKATVKAVDKEICMHRYRNSIFMKNTIFCAYSSYRNDICVGDSGGPAIINGQLCGVISSGYQCGINNLQGVYTSVLAGYKFIKRAMRELSKTDFVN